MSFFSNLINKLKGFGGSTQTSQEDIHEPQIETVDEPEYIPSSKTKHGVPYPNGWELLSEPQILTQLDDFFKAFKEVDGDDDAEDALCEKYGFEDFGHYEDFRNAMRSERAKKEGVSYTQAAMNQHLEQQATNLAAAVNADSSLLAPIEGVSVEAWAKANASVAHSGGIAEALRIVGKDQAGWDRVNAQWNARMSSDASMSIMQVYSAAFTAGATAGQEAISAENFPLERYIEVQTAMDILCDRGQDAQEVLSMFGMSAVDWSNASAFWSQEIASNVEKYHPLHTQYTEKYEAKYQFA